MVVSRLKWIFEPIALNMVFDFVCNYLLSNFGNEVKIIDGSVVFEVILGQVGFFKRGVTYALFHWSEKIFSERERLMILHIGYWYMVC